MDAPASRMALQLAAGFVREPSDGTSVVHALDAKISSAFDWVLKNSWPFVGDVGRDVPVATEFGGSSATTAAEKSETFAAVMGASCSGATVPVSFEAARPPICSFVSAPVILLAARLAIWSVV